MNLGKNPTAPYKLKDREMSLLGLANYGLKNILHFVRTQENRMICVPSSVVTQLREKAISELEANGVQRSLLSEGEVLCAWWTRLIVAHLPPNPRRTVVLNNAYSLRKPLTDVLPGQYTSNAIGFLPVLLPLCEVLSQPVSFVAAEIRRTILQLGTREQVDAFAGLWRKSSRKPPPFFGDPSMYMITFSNWSKAKLYDTDFSSAVVKPREEGSTNVPIKPSYIQNNQFG